MVRLRGLVRFAHLKLQTFKDLQLFVRHRLLMQCGKRNLLKVTTRTATKPIEISSLPSNFINNLELFLDKTVRWGLVIVAKTWRTRT